jgi:hypothetical protein
MRPPPDDVNADLTKVFGRVSVRHTTEILVRGTRDRKVGRVSRYSFYLRLLLVLAVLAVLASVVAGDPWGPK